MYHRATEKKKKFQKFQLNSLFSKANKIYFLQKNQHEKGTYSRYYRNSPNEMNKRKKS